MIGMSLNFAFEVDIPRGNGYKKGAKTLKGEGYEGESRRGIGKN